MKILHICTDEKFINSMAWQFSNLQNIKTRYIVILDAATSSVNHIDKLENFDTVQNDKKGLAFCLEQITQHDATIFHGLNYFQSQIVLQSSTHKNFILFYWGAEFYNNPYALKYKVIGSRTKKIFWKSILNYKIQTLKNYLTYTFKHKTQPPGLSVLSAARKMKYFGSLSPIDMERFKTLGYLNSKVKLLKKCYYPLEFIFKGVENLKISGNNILLGNSATLTNNHLEAFEVLSAIKISNRKVIMPLSYGSKDYAKAVYIKGKTYFGNNVKPLFNFMPLDEYNTLLSSCSIVIMNHYRQQAFGNICAMLWMGAKVYLNEKNDVYPFLKNIGVKVYSITKDLQPNNPLVLEPLDIEVIAKNRQILQNEIGFESLKKELEKGIKSLAYES